MSSRASIAVAAATIICRSLQTEAQQQQQQQQREALYIDYSLFEGRLYNYSLLLRVVAIVAAFSFLLSVMSSVDAVVLVVDVDAVAACICNQSLRGDSLYQYVLFPLVGTHHHVNLWSNSPPVHLPRFTSAAGEGRRSPQQTHG